MAEIMLKEADVPENLKTKAKHLRDDIFSLRVEVVREQAPELLAGYEILSRDAAKDPRQYREAVKRAGSVNKVIIL